MPVSVCIVEPPGHPARGALERHLPLLGDFNIRTTDAVPDPMALDVLVLNSIPSLPDSIPEERVLQYAHAGGGLYCIHDTVFPYGSQPNLIAACGIGAAHGAIQDVRLDGQRVQRTVMLASSDRQNPMELFPIRPAAESVSHPILAGIGEFDLAEEAWAQNLTTAARCLLNADMGHRLPAPARFLHPVPIAACKPYGTGRIAFFSLGHHADTYSNPNVLRFSANAINWVAKRTHESTFSHDFFLSYAAADEARATEIRDYAVNLGLRVFMAGLDLQGGDVWADEIRRALIGSRELTVLMTPRSLESQWVATEWGAAWAMQKRIVPIILQVAPAHLPERLRHFEVVDYHGYRTYVDQMRQRAQA